MDGGSAAMPRCSIVAAKCRSQSASRLTNLSERIGLRRKSLGWIMAWEERRERRCHERSAWGGRTLRRSLRLAKTPAATGLGYAPMRACFLVPELRPSGGIAVVLEHARRLAGHGITAEVLVAGDRRAREHEWDVAIATFWTTWPELHELRARRRAIFLQSVEERFYRDTEPFDRLGADAALAQDAGYLVVATWMRDLLAALRPGVPVWHVPNGIDKTTFAGGEGPRREGPLRVLVEGQPSLWFKGVPEAAAAVRAMRRPAELTVVALDPGHSA